MSFKNKLKVLIIFIQIWLILLSSIITLFPSHKNADRLVLRSSIYKKNFEFIVHFKGYEFIVHFITIVFIYIPLCMKKFRKLQKKYM